MHVSLKTGEVFEVHFVVSKIFPRFHVVDIRVLNILGEGGMLDVMLKGPGYGASSQRAAFWLKFPEKQLDLGTYSSFLTATHH